MNRYLLYAGLVFAAALIASAAPLACNLKAFTPAERADWRKQLDHVMAAVSTARELPDGYSFRVDTHRASSIDVARWIELERKCCPFFSFELSVRGEDGDLWLNLRGGAGVKEFIAEDFRPLFEGLANRARGR